MSRRARGCVLVLLAALALVMLVQPAAVQAGKPPEPEDFIEACSNGIAVPGPEDNPGLVQDCAILLSARIVFLGDDWSPRPGYEPGWTAEKPIGEWPGVWLSRRAPPRVTALWLSYSGLEGQIPPVLGSLTHLTVLDLSWNRLTGGIPSELGALTHLRTLLLQSNSLGGEIPPELGNLAELQWLDLGHSGLTGVLPGELSNLVNLRSLSLVGNDLTGEFPSELERLTRLRTLNLQGNRFKGCLPTVLYLTPGLDQRNLPACPDPAPGETGTGLAPTPNGAVPIAVNVFAVLATALAVLGIVAGFRTRYRL